MNFKKLDFFVIGFLFLFLIVFPGFLAVVRWLSKIWQLYPKIFIKPVLQHCYASLDPLGPMVAKLDSKLCKNEGIKFAIFEINKELHSSLVSQGYTLQW